MNFVEAKPVDEIAGKDKHHIYMVCEKCNQHFQFICPSIGGKFQCICPYCKHSIEFHVNLLEK